MEDLFRKSLAGLLCLVFAQIAAVVMLFSPDHVREAVREEGAAIQCVLGADTADAVFDQAGGIRRLFTDPVNIGDLQNLKRAVLAELQFFILHMYGDERKDQGEKGPDQVHISCIE